MKKVNKLTTILGGLSILPMSLATITSCNSTATYTITFDLDGGSIAGMTGTTMKIASGTTYGQLPCPTKDGKAFSHWTVDSKKVESTTVITSNTTVKANYVDATEAVTVTFDLDGGSISGLSGSTMKVIKGTKYGQLPCPSKAGYSFADWTVNGQTANNNDVIVSDITVKATYGSISGSGLQVTEPTTPGIAENTTSLSTLSSGLTAPTYTFTIPGEFTIPNCEASELEWFVTIGATVTYSAQTGNYSIRLNGGKATKTTGSNFKLSIDFITEDTLETEPYLSTGSFIRAMKSNSMLTVSDLIILNKTTKEAYYCTGTYQFKVVPTALIKPSASTLTWTDDGSNKYYHSSTSSLYLLNVTSTTYQGNPYVKWLCDIEGYVEPTWTTEIYDHHIGAEGNPYAQGSFYVNFFVDAAIGSGKTVKAGIVVEDSDETVLFRQDPTTNPIYTFTTTN